MLDDAVAGFLDGLIERELDVPLMALLRTRGYTAVHLLHGSFEFGKDVIAQQRDASETTQLTFQSKAGDLALREWLDTKLQIEMSLTNDIAHPDFNTSGKRGAILVLTGRLRGGAAPDAQEYKRMVEARNQTFEVWDHETLVEMFASSPGSGLAGIVEAPLLRLLAAVELHDVDEDDLEKLSRRWIESGASVRSSSIIEAAVVASRLRSGDRVDLACIAALALLRGTWASQHGAEPPSDEALFQAGLARRLFVRHAEQLWDACQRLDPDDPIAVLNQEPTGLFVHYPVRCARIVELLSLYALQPEARPEVKDWLRRFSRAQPGVAHPISDRWAVSLLPLSLCLHDARDEIEALLQEVVRWIGDRYENDGRGLGGFDADPREEVEYLLGDPFEHIDRKRRSTSYLATIVLDLASLLEMPAVYDLAYNDTQAVDARPAVPRPLDDVSQYLKEGDAVDVPVDTSPRYVEHWEDGDVWRMAPHHDDDRSRYYLGRLGLFWDHPALSLVLRDRHWVAGLRALLT